MTDVVALAKRLHRKINSQRTPEEVHWMDQVNWIIDAIRQLYVISGRALNFSDDMFYRDEEIEGSLFLKDTLSLDEEEWVLLEAQIEFYKWVQASHDDLVSYSTDAMAVTHGNKPYEHIAATIDRLEGERNRIWYTMVRYNQIGVASDG